MPLYTYHCPSCQHVFDAIHRVSAPKPECPSCGAGGVSKYFGSSKASKPVQAAPEPTPTRWSGDGAFLAAGILIPEGALSMETLEAFEGALGACNAKFKAARLELFAVEPAESASSGPIRAAMVLGRVVARVGIDGLEQVNPRDCTGAVAQLQAQGAALGFLKSHEGTPGALAAALETDNVGLWAGFNNAECCYFDFSYGGIYPKDMEAEIGKEVWRSGVPESLAETLDRDFCGVYWDDQRELVGRRLASTRFKERRPVAVELSLARIQELERDLGAHLSRPGFSLNELTFYWH